MESQAEISKLQLENELLKLERQLKEKELELKELDLLEQEKQEKKSGWFSVNPTILAATIALIAGLIGNMIVYTSGQNALKLEEKKFQSSAALEKMKFQSSLILEAIKTGDSEIAANNLEFFVRTGFIEDTDGKIAEIIAEPDGPVLAANLSGEELVGADLSQADLRGSDFEGADMREANLAGSNLDGVNLKGANLSGANLQNAILNNADLIDAILEDADLTGARYNRATNWPEGFDPVQACATLDGEMTLEEFVTSPPCD